MDGRIKFAIENSTRTRIVVAGQKICILGGFKKIRMAREAVVSLVLGKQPGLVYSIGSIQDQIALESCRHYRHIRKPEFLFHV